jgi:hypothetical protein
MDANWICGSISMHDAWSRKHLVSGDYAPQPQVLQASLAGARFLRAASSANLSIYFQEMKRKHAGAIWSGVFKYPSMYRC